MKRKIIVLLVNLLLLITLLTACNSTATSVPAASDYYRDSRMLAYAEYIAASGLGVQENDEVLIKAPVYTSGLVDLIAEACYKRGACAVNVAYSDPALDNSAMRYLADNSYDELVFNSELTSKLSAANSRVRSLSIVSPVFSLASPETQVKEDYKKAKETFTNSIKDWSQVNFPEKKNWSVVACANADWAQKVYPDLSDAAALSQMWEDIFSFVYLDENASTGSVTDTHYQELDERAQALTAMNIQSLHFVGGDTDVTVRLHQPHRFQGPPALNADGEKTLPNIPCEECFTIPEKTGVNGEVAASRPLLLSDGTVVENMKLTFVDGYLTQWSADTGKEALDELLAIENARYLGEVSLVTADSPIFKSGKLYYNTLIDENACCHMAFGTSYVEYNLPEGVEPDEQCNLSDIHVDFMFGTDDMEVTATLSDGTRKTIMHKGAWAF